MIPRSYLYVPGTRPERFAKAVASGADAVILDLEDAVPPGAKDQARAAVAAFVAAQHAPSVELWVRVNAGPARMRDVAALAGLPALRGLCVAKAESAAELGELAEAAPGLQLEPLLESAAALLEAPRIAAAALGEVDLCADLGATPGPGELELLWARSVVVAASAAAGLAAPVGPVSTELEDVDALRTSTQALLRLGFWGRACVHPAQVRVVNAVATPSAERLAWARDVVERLEAATRAGEGVATDAEGRLLDEAVARSARRVLAQVSG